MTHDDKIIRRDFYFNREVTRKEKIKFMGITLISNAATFYIITLVAQLLSIMQGMALHVLLQALTLLPIAVILPWIMTTRAMRHIVSRFYSLADDVDNWHKKAISIVTLGEAVRFGIGLLPTVFTKFGMITSPVTYHIYSLFYVVPTGRYEQAVGGAGTSFMDTAVFLLIYVLYFAIYEFLFMKKFKKEVIRNKNFLEATLLERKKMDDMYKNRINY